MGTTKLQREFVDFARTRGLAHLHNVPGLGRHIPGMAVVIVGSVASGLCEPSSDINLALFADRDAIDRLHVPRWAEGRPTTT